MYRLIDVLSSPYEEVFHSKGGRFIISDLRFGDPTPTNTWIRGWPWPVIGEPFFGTMGWRFRPSAPQVSTFVPPAQRTGENEWKKRDN